MSFGIAETNKNDTISDALTFADGAMYTFKKHKKNVRLN